MNNFFSVHFEQKVSLLILFSMKLRFKWGITRLFLKKLKIWDLGPAAPRGPIFGVAEGGSNDIFGFWNFLWLIFLLFPNKKKMGNCFLKNIRFLKHPNTLRILKYDFMLEINFAYPVLRKNPNFWMKTRFFKTTQNWLKTL